MEIKTAFPLPTGASLTFRRFESKINRRIPKIIKPKTINNRADEDDERIEGGGGGKIQAPSGKTLENLGLEGGNRTNSSEMQPRSRVILGKKSGEKKSGQLEFLICIERQIFNGARPPRFPKKLMTKTETPLYNLIILHSDTVNYRFVSAQIVLLRHMPTLKETRIPHICCLIVPCTLRNNKAK